MTTIQKGGRRLVKWANQHKSGDTDDEKTSVWGKRLLGGYAGVTHTAKQIIAELPDMSKYKLYVEPFAGLGRTAVHNIPMVLNDKSEFSNEYCKEHFPNASVSNKDFMDTINEHDSEDTFFLIDPPWRLGTYKETDATFCDRTVWEYYDQLLKRIETLKGDWFLLSSADEHEQKNILRDSKWGIKIVQSEKRVIFGKYARTMICSNLFDPKQKDTWVSCEQPAKEGTQLISVQTEYDGTICNICHARYEGDYKDHELRPFHQGCLE